MLDPLAERLPRLFFDDSPVPQPIAVTSTPMPMPPRRLRIPQPTLEAVIVAVLQINGVAGSSAAAMAGDLVEGIKEYYARTGAPSLTGAPAPSSTSSTKVQVPGMPVVK